MWPCGGVPIAPDTKERDTFSRARLCQCRQLICDWPDGRIGGHDLRHAQLMGQRQRIAGQDRRAEMSGGPLQAILQRGGPKACDYRADSLILGPKGCDADNLRLSQRQRFGVQIFLR